MISSEENKEKLAAELAPKVEKLLEERIKFKIVQSIVDTLEERFYPPEELLNPEFVKSVEAAEKRVKSGESVKFKNREDFESFLNKLADA